VTTEGWRALKRLGVSTFVCEHCKTVAPLHLPAAGENIRSRHWHVEMRARNRLWSAVSSNGETGWIVCSQDCARSLSEQKTRERGHERPKIAFVVHGPYTPNDP